MGSAKSSLIKSASGFFLAATCIMYPQQVGGFVAKALGMFGNLFSSIVTPIFLKAIGS
ncbi:MULTISPECIES: hypothetical protein [unclassified Clostridium]|uniref:hypothetical protein n=1 Tax=unclassified Clostridium TaxID=2614128 RepID=UPI000297675E|nr:MULTISPECIES: hypothetical protein [unclassified Clostridium]EKQ56411.1 MAG: hypothetical protein A370_02003 [Clostridium sp. Maddingley MBC34-26]